MSSKPNIGNEQSNVVYQVPNWDETFENYKSRVVTRCSFVCLPSKTDSMADIRVLSEPDGTAVLGIYTLIVRALGEQSKPRNGFLRRSDLEELVLDLFERLALGLRHAKQDEDEADCAHGGKDEEGVALHRRKHGGKKL
jgi:hypothetical protein